MKKVLILISMLATLVFSSCDKELVYSIEIDKHIVNFSADGGKEEITVKANNPWDVFISEGDESWIKISITHSDAIHASFDIMVNSINNTGEIRAGSVFIKNGNTLREVKVNQSFVDIDVPEIEISAIYGTWRLSKCEKAPFMVGSEFVFNEDMNCTATLKMPTGDLSVNGVYVLDGNIIKINSEKKDIDISIENITGATMNALVMGAFDSVLDKIK